MYLRTEIGMYIHLYPVATLCRFIRHQSFKRILLGLNSTHTIYGRRGDNLNTIQRQRNTPLCHLHLRALALKGWQEVEESSANFVEGDQSWVS